MALTLYDKDFNLIRTTPTTTGDSQITYIGPSANGIHFVGVSGVDMTLYEYDGTVNVVRVLHTLTAPEVFQGVAYNHGFIFAVVRDATNSRPRMYDLRGNQIWSGNLGVTNRGGCCFDGCHVFIRAVGAVGTVMYRFYGSSINGQTAFPVPTSAIVALVKDGFHFWAVENGGSNRIVQLVADATSRLLREVKASAPATLTGADGIMTDGNYLYIWT